MASTALLLLLLICSAQAQITIRPSSSVAFGGSGLVTTLGSGSTAEAASGNVTPGLPADWLVNDFLLAVIESRDNIAATMPAGWTLFNEGSGAGGTHRASLFWKFAAPGETAPVVTHPGGNRIVARIVAFRGVDIANPFDTPHAFTASAADTTTEAGSLTTVTSGVTLVFTAHIGAQSTAFTPPSSWSLVGTASSGGGSDGVSIAIYRRPNQNPGVKTALTLTHSNSAESHGAQIALRPLRTVVIAKPAGTALNDTLIATLVLSGQNPTSTPPAGWTLLRRLQGISSAMEVYLKVAGSTEPAEYPWTLSPSVVTGPLAASLQAYAGVDPANPIDIEAGQNTASGLTHATPGVTTTTPNTMLVTAHAYKASGTWTPPSGMTEVIDVATHGAPNSNGVSLENSYALQSSAGAIGAKVATASNNGNTGHAHVLALRPGTSTPRIYFVHTDHLNTPRLITSDAGQTVWQWNNDDPYGNNAPNENPSGAGNFTCNLRLPGQYFDQELNTHYNYFRDYDPVTGRYVESDLIGLRGGLNLYGYVNSNPLNLVDLLGLMGQGSGANAVRPRPPQGAGPTSQTMGAASDFWSNYMDMRNANIIGSDSYFHCKANCQAARRGPSGYDTACRISDTREWVDQNIFGDPISASQADQAANIYGRGWGGNTSLPCELACMPYRPNGLPSRY